MVTVILICHSNNYRLLLAAMNHIEYYSHYCYCSMSKIFFEGVPLSDSDVICYVVIRNILNFISNIRGDAKSAFRESRSARMT